MSFRSSARWTSSWVSATAEDVSLTIAEKLAAAASTLRDEAGSMQFAPPVDRVYNPLAYAWESHLQYIRTSAPASGGVLFLGMNPGPFGMAQTGVPFGEVAAVRDWMGIEVPVGQPEHPHPKRPVEGFACRKSEVSGRRLWGLMAARFGSARTFFDAHFVINYCPLIFMEETGRNHTPEKLPAAERERLFSACDRHLVAALDALQPRWCIGVGAFATARFQSLGVPDGRLGTILHPSPASPAANRGWAEAATRQLVALGVWPLSC